MGLISLPVARRLWVLAPGLTDQSYVCGPHASWPCAVPPPPQTYKEQDGFGEDKNSNVAELVQMPNKWFIIKVQHIIWLVSAKRYSITFMCFCYKIPLLQLWPGVGDQNKWGAGMQTCKRCTGPCVYQGANKESRTVDKPLAARVEPEPELCFSFAEWITQSTFQKYSTSVTCR